MAGCQLAVIVVEGGEVQSTGSATCVAGTVCIVDVDHPNFSETFTAVPEAGWYFKSWHKGDRFLCAGSIDSDCTLSFEGYEETEAVLKIVESSNMFYLMPVFAEYSGSVMADEHTVSINGRQWMQPSLFNGITWKEINAVCPNSTGLCEGELNGYNMTGWIWTLPETVVGFTTVCDLHMHHLMLRSKGKK
jgi:hypothetical protein